MRNFKLKKKILPYNTCKDIYRESTLGKRVVEGIVNFATSTGREVNVKDAPEMVKEKFRQTAQSLNQWGIIRNVLFNSRVYGTGGLYVSIFDKEKKAIDFTSKPTFNELEDKEIRFVALDPLNMSGSIVDMDPTSYTFLELIDLKVGGNKVSSKRLKVVHALENQYLDQRTDLIPYAPPSVYYNMINLINEYEDAVKSLGDILYKAGAIIYKYKDVSKMNGISIDSISASKKVIELKQSGEVIAIDSNSDITDFPLANITGLIDSINKLEEDIAKALNDTPLSILFDKSLSNGFSEGDKDKETEISIVEAYRENKIKPLIDFTDYYVMVKAWDEAFIEEVKSKYKEYEGMTNTYIFSQWVEMFEYSYKSLHPDSDNVTQENIKLKLENIKLLKELGVDDSDIEREINSLGVFSDDVAVVGSIDDNEEFIESEEEGKEADTTFIDRAILIDKKKEQMMKLTDDEVGYLEDIADDSEGDILDYKLFIKDKVKAITDTIFDLINIYKEAEDKHYIRNRIESCRDVRDNLINIYYKLIDDLYVKKINKKTFNDNIVRLYDDEYSKYNNKQISKLKEELIHTDSIVKKQKIEADINNLTDEIERMFLENVRYQNDILNYHIKKLR